MKTYYEENFKRSSFMLGFHWINTCSNNLINNVILFMCNMLYIMIQNNINNVNNTPKSTYCVFSFLNQSILVVRSIKSTAINKIQQRNKKKKKYTKKIIKRKDRIWKKRNKHLKILKRHIYIFCEMN